MWLDKKRPTMKGFQDEDEEPQLQDEHCSQEAEQPQGDYAQVQQVCASEMVVLVRSEWW